ncbi:MAG: hypothetical protein FWG52_05295 [Proteobacteria bacterium]|nr:hypothetical protein [Pseudomonadota bacterium]
MINSTNTAASGVTIETFRAFFGRHPDDVISALKTGSETLDWLCSIFVAIKERCEKGDSIHPGAIKNLVEIGLYLAGDFSNFLGCEFEELERKIEAAKALEG